MPLRKLAIGQAILIVLLALVLTLSYFGGDSVEPARAAQEQSQKLVMLKLSGGSYLLPGDSLHASEPALAGETVPKLLERGWRIISVHVTSSREARAGETAAHETAAFVLLEKR